MPFTARSRRTRPAPARRSPARPGRYIGDAATLVRLYAGRPLDGAHGAAGYEPAGVDAAELHLFGG
ncbi:hypothetical protein ACVV2G_22505 [Streptomyces ziwulingensis]